MAGYKQIDPKVGENTQFKPGQSGNPNGAPKRPHISTWIQQLLNDEDFVGKIQDGNEVKEYKGAPMKAIIMAQIQLAIKGDTKAFDVLGKYGFGTKVQLGNDPDNPLLPTQQLTDEELNARLKQIVAAGEGRSVSNPSGTRSATSQE